MIIIYGLDTLKSVFIQAQGFDMIDNHKFTDFKVAEENGDNAASVLKLGKPIELGLQTIMM